ncbi:MAG: hypothetical protein PHE68_03955 [Candidatus Peribacteraceae bacterium]|nr:hypothetical protein [Candidatus Peribacteraceae bacterium]
MWLFLNTLPQLFLQDYIGGIFLWLFIIPGVIVLWQQKNRRLLLLSVVGLWLSMEFFLRFILHYGRVHLMDWGWALPIVAAVGIIALADMLHQRWRHIPALLFSVLMTFIIVGQMGQANRKLFALRYSHSFVPSAYAAAQALAQLPVHAVIARPNHLELLFFSDREAIEIANQTIEYLAQRGKVREPFDYYHVTHIIGYDNDTAALITNAVPAIKNVEISPSKDSMIVLSPMVKYLLNTIR